MTHLDTNFLIRALVSGSSEETKLLGWLSAGETVRISAIAWSEFLCGPLSPQDEALARQFLSEPEPFIGVDAARAADLFNRSGRRSRTLPDCQIAAVALRCGAVLATGNTKDFAPFQAHGLSFA